MKVTFKNGKTADVFRRCAAPDSGRFFCVDCWEYRSADTIPNTDSCFRADHKLYHVCDQHDEGSRLEERMEMPGETATSPRKKHLKDLKQGRRRL